MSRKFGFHLNRKFGGLFRMERYYGYGSSDDGLYGYKPVTDRKIVFSLSYMGESEPIHIYIKKIPSGYETNAYFTSKWPKKKGKRFVINKRSVDIDELLNYDLIDIYRRLKRIQSSEVPTKKKSWWKL